MPNESVQVEWLPDASELFIRAKNEAMAIGDTYLGTEHPFLATIAYASNSQVNFAGLSHESAPDAVLAATGPHGPEFVCLTPWSQTPRLKLAITYAISRARAESRAVNCGDIWCGLLADPDSNVAKTVRHLSVGTDELRTLFATSNGSSNTTSQNKMRNFR
jgi:hypothetical protein